MTNRLEIKLSEANNKLVSLKSLTPEAFDSFMAVTSALKSLVVSVSTNEELIFSFSEGSALCAVESSEPTMQLIYNAMDIAIKGESEDKEVTSNLRKIQEQISRAGFKYSFKYEHSAGRVIDLYPRIFEANRIAVKRTRKPYIYKLKVVKGFLNQIGGNDPNYHFDYGHGDRLTIVCSMEEARDINKYLYQDVTSLLLCKEWTSPEKKDEYYHKMILEDNMVDLFRLFLSNYNKKMNLLDKLEYIHDFIDESFENSDSGHEILKSLLIAFNTKYFHLSELKTLLVISKPFKDHAEIKIARNLLFETYKQVRD